MSRLFGFFRSYNSYWLGKAHEVYLRRNGKEREEQAAGGISSIYVQEPSTKTVKYETREQTTKATRNKLHRVNRESWIVNRDNNLILQLFLALAWQLLVTWHCTWRVYLGLGLTTRLWGGSWTLIYNYFSFVSKTEENIYQLGRPSFTILGLLLFTFCCFLSSNGGHPWSFNPFQNLT